MRNPLEVLRLGADATLEQIVETGARLAQRGEEAAREAVQQLIASDEMRTLHAWLTPPGSPVIDPEVQRFLTAHRRPPPDLPLRVPPVSPEELRERLREALLEELQPRPVPLSLVPVGESTEELSQQRREVKAQSLLYDLRG